MEKLKRGGISSILIGPLRFPWGLVRLISLEACVSESLNQSRLDAVAVMGSPLELLLRSEVCIISYCDCMPTG